VLQQNFFIMVSLQSNSDPFAQRLFNPSFLQKVLAVPWRGLSLKSILRFGDVFDLGRGASSICILIRIKPIFRAPKYTGSLSSTLRSA